MDELFMTPITQLKYQRGVGLTEGTQTEQENPVSSFGDVFRSMVNEAAEAERNFDKQKYLLATGQIENAQTVMIAGSYAQLTIDMVMNLRNKALEAYQELMRLNV